MSDVIFNERISITSHNLKMLVEDFAEGYELERIMSQKDTDYRFKIIESKFFDPSIQESSAERFYVHAVTRTEPEEHIGMICAVTCRPLTAIQSRIRITNRIANNSPLHNNTQLAEFFRDLVQYILVETGAIDGKVINSTAPTSTEQSGLASAPRKWQPGRPPQTRAEKKMLAELWDAIPRDERPRLEDWLIEQCGTDLATGMLLVPCSTFRGWRKL